MTLRFRNPYESQSPPLLRIAVLHSSLAAVQSHIERGHDLDARDEKGRTSLMLSALKGYVGICEQLINSGADPLLQDDEDRNAFDIAEQYGHSNVMELLRKYFPSPLLDYTSFLNNFYYLISTTYQNA